MTAKRTAAGIVREKISWIENRLRNGHSREAIWEELKSKHGLTLTFSSFLKTMHRVRTQTKHRKTFSKVPESDTEALLGISEESPRELSEISNEWPPASFVELQRRLEHSEKRSSENYIRLQRTLILVGSTIFLTTLLSNLWPLFL